MAWCTAASAAVPIALIVAIVDSVNTVDVDVYETVRFEAEPAINTTAVSNCLHTFHLALLSDVKNQANRRSLSAQSKRSLIGSFVVIFFPQVWRAYPLCHAGSKASNV